VLRENCERISTMGSHIPKTVILITGANTGLGFGIAKALFARPEPNHILMGCRGEVSRAGDAIRKLELLFPSSTSTAEGFSIDITSDESIAAAFAQIEKEIGYVDVLVNNAGADFDAGVTAGRITKRESWNCAWDVNVTGTHLFTEAFAPLLLASKAPAPRLLFITSGLASVTELSNGTTPKYTIPPAGWPKPDTLWLAYRSSKAGLNMLAAEWSRVLRNDGVKVFNISPGFLNTRLADDREEGKHLDKSKMGALDPAVGGEWCADVVGGKRDEEAWPIRTLRKHMVQPW